MLAVLAASLQYCNIKVLKNYLADQALSISARMTQIDRYLTLIIKSEMRAFSKSWDALRIFTFHNLFFIRKNFLDSGMWICWKKIRGWWDGLFNLPERHGNVANRRAIWRSMAVPCFGHSVPRCHMSSVMPCLDLKPWLSSRLFEYIAS
jgi:hypothetical protein